MEQQNKYYTPDISELHTGYECQIGNLFALPGSRWEWAETKPLKWSTIAFIAQAMIPEHLVYIRTKYLDQSDIESCGWENCRKLTDWFGKNDKVNQVAFDKENMMLGYDYDTHILVIMVKDPTKSEDGKTEVFDYPKNAKWFRGECKSINELKKIMQWLNIK